MSSVAENNATACTEENHNHNNAKLTANRKRNIPMPEDNPLIRALALLDPVLQFLTRASGQSMVPLKSLLSIVPNSRVSQDDVLALFRHGVLQLHPPLVADNAEVSDEFKKQWNLGKDCDTKFSIGFPNPDEQRLSGSTNAAAKRRLAALKRRVKQGGNAPQEKQESTDKLCDPVDAASSSKDWTLPVDSDPEFQDEPLLERESDARKALKDMLGLEFDKKPDLESMVPTMILPKQISYAGTHPAQGAIFDQENKWRDNVDPRIVASVRRQLYSHQAVAIQSALRNIPTLVCTGTGSGKSLCFLIPVLNAALRGEKSMLLFPTKALAQDQVIKLTAWLEEHGLHHEIRAATLDGDTPHSRRVDIITSCNVILTNPDTLHASIMPNWKHLYRPLLTNLRYVVIDEAHMYTGVFGAHVSMILARLYRLVSIQESKLCFLACSATLAHPEAHFRLLCCMPRGQTINVVKEDGSPRAAKHFWVWNPPLLDVNGKNLGRVQRKRKKLKAKVGKEGKTTAGKENQNQVLLSTPVNPYAKKDGPIDLAASPNTFEESRDTAQHRRHSADETALLLALAVSRGIRTIAFCKTRCLVEWVYERTLAALKQSKATADLCHQVESYRGGYTKVERRQIEERLFNNQLLGVVGTSALELGVDIGGVDLTLHCGFPSSHENLIQQAGRAGRGANASTSMAICVCFNSPMDQHLWRHPGSLLSCGYSAPISMPIYSGLVQGHLLCAGQEYPLTGAWNALVLKAEDPESVTGLLSDKNLFGSSEVYEEAMENLLSQGSLVEETVATTSGTVVAHKTHPSIKNPWTQVSIRAIEPVSYQIVDVSHPKQAGRTDGIHDEAAILDTIPYSRIFYHAFPGAVITHRNRRYKITCMTRPPACGGKAFRGSVSLGAFAKPCNLRYYTRPLSSLTITVVKQMERVDFWGGTKAIASQATTATDNAAPASIPDVTAMYSDKGPDPSFGSFAGCGVVTVKRNVHGYKKMSMVTREEISRSELSLPDMEFDSLAFWIDCHSDVLSPQLGDMAFGHGVHALSHALVAVAPLFVPCTVSDVYCDHSVYGPTRVTIFDARAGGSGICAQLWKSVFIPNGILEAALGLLEDCPSCSDDINYDGGCPACLHAGECIKFNDFLSKSSGLVIGKHMLTRLKETELYKQNEREMKDRQAADGLEANDGSSAKVARNTSARDVTSPRRRRRERAMRNAQGNVSARDRQVVVVGRPSWPMDRSDGPRQENTGD